MNSQSWKYKSGGNVFDGEYKAAYVIGKCDDFPYNKPVLYLNVFKESDLNFYIGESGYYSDEAYLDIIIVVDKESDNYYTAENLSLSKDGKIIFLDSFKNKSNEHLSTLEFLEVLKKASRIDVRINSRFDKRDMFFSMNGSSAAINHVITDNYLSNRKKVESRISKRADSLYNIELQKQKELQRLIPLLAEQGVVDEEFPLVLRELEFEVKHKNLDLSIVEKIIPKLWIADYVKFQLYSKSDSLLSEFSVNAPLLNLNLIKEKKQQEIIERKKDSLLVVKKEEDLFLSSKIKIRELIKRYDFPKETNEEIMETYQKAYSLKSFNLEKELDSINITKLQKKDSKAVMRLYCEGKWIVTLNELKLPKDFIKDLKPQVAY